MVSLMGSGQKLNTQQTILVPSAHLSLKVLVPQSFPTLHDFMDCSPPVSFENPLSLGFSKQEYRSGLPFSSPRDLPDPGIEFGSPALQEWRRQWHSTPVLLPGKSHGWRSLVGCSPWGRKESDMTEGFHFDFSLSCTGEGNDKPLHYPGLENPRDGGA